MKPYVVVGSVLKRIHSLLYFWVSLMEPSVLQSKQIRLIGIKWKIGVPDDVD